MLALGTSLPAFRLPDLDGRLVSPDDVRDAPALLIAFICHHCPFVRHIRHEFARVTREYQGRGLAVIAINSNDIEEFPQDGPEGMRQESREAGYGFPYLFDESQDVAKAFRAACTPDLFLFDAARRLVYRGQFDGSHPRCCARNTNSLVGPGNVPMRSGGTGSRAQEASHITHTAATAAACLRVNGDAWRTPSRSSARFQVST